ncbi:hypothetical protein [Actinosynnema sp. NPDC023587]|uniref:hypothetical protein n=1 Tax=Actinosynnema sp. NPDC023587 TaxID=3154695 RepID=UPI0033F67CBD
MTTPPDPSNDAIGERLRHIAAVAVVDKKSADELLWDWIGRTPTPAGEERMRLLAQLAPRLVADEVTRAGWGGRTGMWALDRPVNEDLPPDVLAVAQAVVRHLNGEHDTAEEIIDAYTGPLGVQGLWGVGTAALRLLAAELNDQRADQADDARP